jgi:lysophospholipase L1-like esterase
MKYVKKIKKLLLATVLATVFMAGQIVPGASAQGNTGATQNDRGSIIWSGLWAGSHFDLSSLGFAAPAKRPTPAPTTPPAAQNTYAALGDSVAAGLGLPGVATPTGNDTRCGRSAQSYVYTVANKMKLPLLHAACSGATAGDLFTRQGVSGPNITAQLTTAYASGKPQLITITAGANDAHWDEFIRTCYATNCANRTTTLLANGYLVSLQTKLYVAFSSIVARSAGTPPTVVITGYYNPLSASCTKLQTNITAEEITWLTAETAALNQTIKNVGSHYSFVRFAPVDFTGHDVCSASPWVQGVSATAPFHPTAAGQQVIGQSVIRSLGY